MYNTMLQFSGGKDSLACLYLYRDFWEDNQFCVLWCNTGAAYPETVEYMNQWKKKIKHFIELKTDQPSTLSKYGYPVDVVPISNTNLGKALGLKRSILLQSYTECCARNIWNPMHEAVKFYNVKNVVRGQRNDETRTAPVRSGYIEEGVRYIFPLQDWTEGDVFAFLKNVNAELPEYYAKGENTSHDCWDCTAYLDEQGQRIFNLPEQKRVVMFGRLKQIDEAIKQENRYAKYSNEIRE